MEKSAGRLLYRLPLRLREPTSTLSHCPFSRGYASLPARPTRPPMVSSPTTTMPRNATAALLELGDASNANADDPGFKEALRQSREAIQASRRANEERRFKDRNQQGIERMMARKWQGGDLYTPHDLTPREILKFTKMKRPSRDIFDSLGINPIDAYKNPVLLAEFMTSGGRIKHPSETGLRPVNQRKIAKTIRRAIGLGLMPSCHVHPEMLRRFGPDQNSRKYRWK